MNNRLLRFIRKNSSGILTGMNIIGSIVTTGLTIHSTVKASDIIKDKNLTKKEKVKQVWKFYISPAISLTATIGCSVGAQVKNKQIQSMLTSAYLLSENRLKDYRSVVVDELGAEKEEQLYLESATRVTPIPPQFTEDTVLFVDEFSGEAFWSTMTDVMAAENELNRTFSIQGYVSYNTFRRYLGLKELDELTEDFGWEQYAGEFNYGYKFIDFMHTHMIDENDKEFIQISIPFGPHPMWDDLAENGFWKEALYSYGPSEDDVQIPLS